MDAPLRILIVDDSATVRRVIRELLTSDPGITVVGEAADGAVALRLVNELRPDLVTLDVRMPVMDGVETTRRIMAERPTPILVLTASIQDHDVDITFKMLGAGALDVVEKPRLNDSDALERARRDLVRRVRLLARVKVVTHLRGRRRIHETAADGEGSAAAPLSGATKPAQAAKTAYTTHTFRLPLIIIGASTGGPRVVRQILAGLPTSLPAAVIVVQHIASGFSGGMADWLSSSVALPVRLAAEGDKLHSGSVLVAPDRYDLLVRPDGTVRLSRQPILLQQPAIDITMQSAAEVFGAQVIGVLLTGMGRDGAIGMQAIRRFGGYTIAQDEASCTIYGMPRAAVELGAVDQILAPPQIAAELVALTAHKGRS